MTPIPALTPTEALERLLTALSASGMTQKIMDDPTDPALHVVQEALLNAEFALNLQKPKPKPPPKLTDQAAAVAGGRRR